MSPTLQDTVQQHNALPWGDAVALRPASTTASTYSMVHTIDFLTVDSTAAPVAVALPADPYLGKQYTIAEVSGINGVTISPAAAGTIDGAASFALAAGKVATFAATSIDRSTATVTWSLLAQTAPNPGAGGELLAANNLSDVASASTARTNLDAGQVSLSIPRLALDSAGVYRYVHLGPDATVTGIASAITGALAVGSATITASIDGVPITDGAITIDQVGSAAGDQDLATPTAANLLATLAVLELTVGGTNTAPEFADVSVQLVY